MTPTLPNEIYLEIFSHMSLEEIHRMGTVCRSWQGYRDSAIVFQMQQQQAKLHICTSPKLHQEKTMDFFMSSFDTSTNLVEFRPPSGNTTAFDSAEIKGLRMVMESWSHESPRAPQASHLDPVQSAQFLFHHQYIPIQQQLYLVPHETCVSNLRYWIGDISIGAVILLEKDANTSQCTVIMARVSISWLLSGYRGSRHVFMRHYYRHLKTQLNTLGPETRNLICDSSTGTFLVDQQYGLHTALGRWQQLHHQLNLRHIDTSVIWKYHVGKLYILGKSSLTLREITDKIYLSEQEWQKMKPEILKAISAASSSETTTFGAEIEITKTPSVQIRLYSLFI